MRKQGGQEVDFFFLCVFVGEGPLKNIGAPARSLRAGRVRANHCAQISLNPSAMQFCLLLHNHMCYLLTKSHRCWIFFLPVSWLQLPKVEVLLILAKLVLLDRDVVLP